MTPATTTAISGTSMATPRVAGVAALIVSEATGGGRVPAIRAALHHPVLNRSMCFRRWPEKVATSGRLNADRALATLAGMTAATSAKSRRAARRHRPASTTASASAAAPPPSVRPPAQARCIVPNVKGKTVAGRPRLLAVSAVRSAG